MKFIAFNNLFNALKSILSGTGELSAKRATGLFMMVIVMGCIVFLTISEGGTDVVECLLQTAMIISASLLGITSITGIWKNGKVDISNDKDYKEKTQQKKDP